MGIDLELQEPNQPQIHFNPLIRSPTPNPHQAPIHLELQIDPAPTRSLPAPASLELSTPESSQSGDQVLEIGDDEWMSVVDKQDIIHELEELETEVNTEDETDYSDLESIWSVEPNSEIDEIEIEE